MKHRTPGTKFSPARELRKNFNSFPSPMLGKLNTDEYVELFCQKNSYVKSKYIINGREVEA